MSRLLSRRIARCTPVLAALSTIPILILTGCGASTTFSAAPTASTGVHGKVIGGQKPIVGSTVTVWVIGADIPGGQPAMALNSTTTQADGSFSFAPFDYGCSTGEPLYITAAGGQSTPDVPDNTNIMLAAGVGDCSIIQSVSVEINEVTTAATAFVLAQFFTETLGTGSDDSFNIYGEDYLSFLTANSYTIPLLVDLPSGTVNPSTPSITIEAAKIYSIANTLSACINDDSTDASTCATLYADTTPPFSGATPPSDTLQAAVQMALYPYQNVSDLYKLAPKPPPFLGLGAAPNDWTLAVSFTSSDFGLGINGTSHSGTSSTIDIDEYGNVWFPSNLPGSTGAGYFDPTTNTFNGPYMLNDLVHPQYIAVDEDNGVWMTDSNSPNIAYMNQYFDDFNFPAFASTAVGLGPISIDINGNAEFSWIDTSATANLGQMTPSGTATALGTFTNPPTGLSTIYTLAGDVLAGTSGVSTPCLLEVAVSVGSPHDVDTLGTSCISGGSAFAQNLDYIAIASSANQYCSGFLGTCMSPAVPLSKPEGIATDGYGYEWIANAGNASVSTFGPFNQNTPASSYPETSPIVYLHDAANGATMTIPYGIAIDGAGDVWISNASCVSNTATPCTPTSFTLSELIGAAGLTIAPLSDQAEGILAGTPYLRGGKPSPLTRAAHSPAHPSLPPTVRIPFLH
jgi:hypothetical protein